MTTKEAELRQQLGQPEAARVCNHLGNYHTTTRLPLQALTSQALARANRDLAAARVAYHQGDRAEYLRLRRRGLRHQCLYLALRGVGP